MSRSLDHLRLGSATLALALIASVGFMLRWVAALTLTPHVDEPSSVLAAHMVAERGLPILPSGTPYFQGLTLSVLLQPFVWLGLAEIHHLTLMRMVLVVAGTATVYVSYRVGQVITGSATIGTITAALVAIDPVSVQWSAHVRMYGLLQLLTFLLLWAYIRLLQGNTSWRQVALVTGLFWLAVFTHVGGSLLGPAMALGAALVYRRSVVRQWRVLAAVGASALAPVAMMLLNRMFGAANEPVREATSVSLWSFVGSNLLAPLAALDAVPREGIVQRLAAGVTLYWLIPGLVVAVSTVFGARLLLRRHRGERDVRVSVLTLLAFYWLPIALVVCFTMSPEVRYLLHMHLLGYVFVAVLIANLLRRAAARSQEGIVFGAVWRLALVIAVALGIGAGLLWRLDNPVHQPDYNAAMAYVAEHHRPGEPVIVTLPPVGYLSVDETSRDDVYFLAGSEGFTRADRYTRWAADGRLIDYWIGADSIVSTRTLDAILEEHPNAWVIADDGRLDSDWIRGGVVERVIRDEMFPVYRSDGGAVVYQTKPAGLSVAGGDVPALGGEGGTGGTDASPPWPHRTP